jgi:hypothetical protein
MEMLTGHFSFLASINFIPFHPEFGEVSQPLKEVLICRLNREVQCRAQEILAGITREEPVMGHRSVVQFCIVKGSVRCPDLNSVKSDETLSLVRRVETCLKVKPIS